MRSRPLPVTVAAVVQALFSLLSLPGPLLPGSEGVPALVLYSGLVLGVGGLVACAGLWMLKRWACGSPSSSTCSVGCLRHRE